MLTLASLVLTGGERDQYPPVFCLISQVVGENLVLKVIFFILDCLLVAVQKCRYFSQNCQAC